VRHRARNDAATWERAYQIVLKLPAPRGIDFLRMLCGGNAPVFASRRLQPFVREVCPHTPEVRKNRAKVRQADLEWLRQLQQREISDHAIRQEFEGVPDLSALLKHLRDGRLIDRRRATVVLASCRRIPTLTTSRFLGVSKHFVRRYRDRFRNDGAKAIFAPQRKSNRKIDNEQLRSALFGLLHEPPSNYGHNRASWTMPLLSRVLKEKGKAIGPALIRKMLKASGYKWRKAKIVLTSTDPSYSEKVARIHSILGNLGNDEAFFSIDEFGPFAVKTKSGRRLTPPGFQPTVPQWQKSRGCLIVTGALELSRNQVTHFYSSKKNTAEMIRMMNRLVKQYAQLRTIYLSWDAASWHISKRLYAHIEDHNVAAPLTGCPQVDTAPLPAGAQFLNVIESVFSGMARAIIHNSDYPSVDDAKAAIDRYFRERNAHFREHPQGAGKKIWGRERQPAVFSEANNCKDPKYR
jgi:transposase